MIEEQAATKIQALYRGFKTRVKLKEQAEHFDKNPKQTTETKAAAPSPPPRANSSAKSAESERLEKINTSHSNNPSSAVSGLLSSLPVQFSQKVESISKEAEAFKQQAQKQIDTAGETINSGVNQLEKGVTEIKQEAEQLVQQISEQAKQAKEQLQGTVQGAFGSLIGSGESSAQTEQSKSEQRASEPTVTVSGIDQESDLATGQKDIVTQLSETPQNQSNMEQLTQEIVSFISNLSIWIIFNSMKVGRCNRVLAIQY